MDSYTIEDVKQLINSNMLSSEILSNILENTARDIKIHDNEESINLLKYLNDNNNIPIEVKEEIQTFLNTYSNYENNSNEDISNIKKTSLVYLIVGFILLLLGLVIFLIIR